MIRKCFNPSDFINNFSPLKKAELYIQYIKEDIGVRSFPLTNKIYSFLRKFYVRYVANPNDIEAEKAWNYMKKKWGDTKSKTVIKYLEEKFVADHLRKFEYAFLAKCLIRKDTGRKLIVDMGGGYSYSTVTPMLFHFPKCQVYSIDVVDYPRFSKYGVRYIKGNCTYTNLSDKTADLVSIISTLEHVGLGRYGDPKDPCGDIKTMKEVRRILKKGGHVVLTVPYGYPTVVYNLHRVYDEGRFNEVTEGFEKVAVEYTLFGKKAKKEQVEGRKVTKDISGFYQNVPKEKQILNPPGGVMALLKKV